MAKKGVKSVKDLSLEVDELTKILKKFTIESARVKGQN